MDDLKLTEEQVKKIQEDFVEQLKQMFLRVPNIRPVSLIGYDGNSNLVAMPFADMPFKMMAGAVIQAADGMREELNKNNKDVN